MKIIKWLAAFIIISFLVAPAPALTVYSIHIEKVCPLISGVNSSSRTMNCTGTMNCHGKCSSDSYHSQGCTCSGEVPSFSSMVISDWGYSYFGKGGSDTYDKERLSTSSSHSVNEKMPLSPIQTSYDGIGPPDLDVIEYLPPSAKLVFGVLESNGPLTQKDLISRTKLPTTTVRYALSKLREEGIINEYFYFPDARQSLYRLNTAASGAQRK
jgi:hypothetical protein